MRMGDCRISCLPSPAGGGSARIARSATRAGVGCAASNAGWIGCVSAVIVFFLLLATNHRYPAPGKLYRAGGRAFAAFAPLVLVIVGYNLFTEFRTPWPIFRDEIFTQHAAASSLGNLIWPLGLQLSISARSLRWRIAFLCMLAPVVAYSPYRAVQFAAPLFGIALPAALYVIDQIRVRGLRSPHAIAGIAAAGIVILAIALQIGFETLGRPTDLKREDGIIAQISGKLGQRLAIPLAQAHLAQAYDLDPEVPSATQEILQKLRLAAGPGMNGYLFAKTHSNVSYEETTSLFFGEGVLRTASHPLIWPVVAPFCLVLAWAGLRQFGHDAGALIGLAIWRSSLGGLVGLMPSLVIQIGLFVGLQALLGSKSKEQSA